MAALLKCAEVPAFHALDSANAPGWAADGPAAAISGHTFSVQPIMEKHGKEW